MFHILSLPLRACVLLHIAGFQNEMHIFFVEINKCYSGTGFLFEYISLSVLSWLSTNPAVFFLDSYVLTGTTCQVLEKHLFLKSTVCPDF